MIQSIEVQVISRLLTTDKESDIDTLLGFDKSYFSAYPKEYDYIKSQYERYQQIPSRFDFMAQFNDFIVVDVPETLNYLVDKLKENKRYIILLETFNKVSTLGDGDVNLAWNYIESQCEKANMLNDARPMNIISEADERAKQVQDLAKQTRIPTGFDDIDKLMYGGLSTVEELLLLLARTGSGKSWVCTKMMESAQANGFPVAYYSPEMQAAYLATRFDTWRDHFKNNELFLGEYTDEYWQYITKLKAEETGAFIIEDKDYPEGVSPRVLGTFVKKEHIKLLIVDGMSYMIDDQGATVDHQKYKNIAGDLFKLSKRFGCAVVLVAQANRETKGKDDKGDALPSLYNVEGSDHPARICTQAFGIRQIFDKHILDIALLKARMANNQNPVFSYNWDINTGHINRVSSSDSDVPSVTDTSSPIIDISGFGFNTSSAVDEVVGDDDNVEF